MTVPVLSAAKHIAERSGWSLTHLELQKLLYLAHMFYLGRTNGSPLIDGNFEAWNYGPVHPTLYHHVKVFGSSPVGNLFRSVGSIPSQGPEAQILDEALRDLTPAPPGRLVAATHRRGGAWDRNYIPGARHIVIPNADILDEYRGLDDDAATVAA